MFLKNLRTLLLASALSAAPFAAVAQTVAESGEAGETLATAQVVAGSVTRITGTLQNLGSIDLPIDDIDLYRITIVNPALFGVTIEADLIRPGAPAGEWDDTMLFLFNAAGVQVGFNDDPVGPGVDPIFLPGQFAGLAPGDYFLGFDMFPTHSVLTGGVLTGWDRSVTVFSEGTYALNLTGTVGGRAIPEGGVPEPSSWALMILGFGAVGATIRRRRIARPATV